MSGTAEAILNLRRQAKSVLQAGTKRLENGVVRLIFSHSKLYTYVVPLLTRSIMPQCF